MKILSVAPDVRERIEIGDDSRLPPVTYYRYGRDAWFVVMGESEEPVLRCKELEALYQGYIGHG